MKQVKENIRVGLLNNTKQVINITQRNRLNTKLIHVYNRSYVIALQVAMLVIKS
jgi:hypothetical protein